MLACSWNGVVWFDYTWIAPLWNWRTYSSMQCHSIKKVCIRCQYVLWHSSTLTIVIPALCILFLNIKNLSCVRHQSIKRKSILNVFASTLKQSTKCPQSVRIAKTICVLTVCFFICWLPFFVFCKISVFSDYKVSYLADVIFLWLGYANSMMNPLLYLIMENKSCFGKISCVPGK
jgi:hypothetical protein